MNKIEELRCDIYIICEIGGVLEDVILYCRGERYDYNTSGRKKEDFLTLTEGLRKL